MMREIVVSEDDGVREVEVYDANDNLLHTYRQSLVPPEPAPEERIAALEDAVDTLILDQLGGQ